MKNTFSYPILFLFIIFSNKILSQDITNSSVNYFERNKGKVYIYWGWNLANYSNSDIRFRGDDYDFTLKNVEAKDRQTKFGFDPYFKIDRITIPQTNLRIGYFITDKYEVSFGIDHMKYVMVQNQEVSISGNINEPLNIFNGNYNNEKIKLTDDFLQFEHTDGLNYVNFEFRVNDNWFNYEDKIGINTLYGGGVGFLLPRTNTKLMLKERHDKFDLSGYGLGAVIGLNINLFKYFFLQCEVKGGFIHMPSIRTTENSSDYASQHFFFSQYNATFGFIYPIFS